MRRLIEYIYENLSSKNIERLKEYINDENIDEYLKTIENHSLKKEIKENNFKDFFVKHGIWDLNYGRKNNAIKQFVSLFAEESHLNILIDIVKNDGACSIKDLDIEGNIFDYCKIDGNDFSDEGRTIATWTFSGSNNIGYCELLLRFILKEGSSLGSGDVGIRNGSDQEDIEVKASTISSKKKLSGGHSVGQKGDIKTTGSMYFYLEKNLFHNDQITISDANKIEYFQNLKGIDEFNKKIKELNFLSNDDGLKKVSKGIVDAICYQYNFISDENNFENELKEINKLYKVSYEFLKKNSSKEKINNDALINLIGCIQLYLYSQIERFNYFFTVLIDKNDENDNSNNGKYWLVKNCQNDDSKLLDFNEVVNHLNFGKLDSTTSSRGRTGKIYILR